MRRRTFLLGALGSAAGTAGLAAQERPLVTFTDWYRASRAERARGIEACLARIAARDAEIQAWVQVAPQGPTGDGPLAGIPFAAKDIMETRGLSTAYGSPVYAGRVGTADADIIQRLRGQGAVLLGKTHTTAFAYRTPAPTKNPRNLAHTPGGSSAGSAAAVAADMVPLALGTQTRGSVLRPASYCGITGFKASYGRFSLEGVLPLAAGLDTLGFFTHTAADMLLFWEAFGQQTGQDEALVFGVPEPMLDVDPAMAAAFRDAIGRIRGSGLSVRPVDIGPMLTRLAAASDLIQAYEAARHHAARFEEHGDRLQDLAALVRRGRAIPAAQYEEAQREVADGKARIGRIYQDTPVVLVPAAADPAPRGYATTGDPRMNAPWTALGTPAISIPMPVGTALPLGLQLTAAQGQDARVIRAAVRLERALAG